MKNDSVALSTNICEIPFGVFNDLAHSLDAPNNIWQILSSDSADASFSLRPNETEKITRSPDAGAQYLRYLGNRGQTVEQLIKRLHALAKTYGSIMEKPQLILHRKFCPVIWSRVEQVVVTVVGDGNQLRLECKASGFPLPHYEWLENEKPFVCDTGKALMILRCPCTARNVFKCRVYNFVGEGEVYSDFYRQPRKIYQSELISNLVDLSGFVTGPNPNCEQCNRDGLDQMYHRIINGLAETKVHEDIPHDVPAGLNTTAMDPLIASDKVALIISNRTYSPNMTNLITPHCDAETIAEQLQQMKFKTVTLGDLTHAEMKFILKEYRKLLGDGVYAVFYFVGHGFEANGQCYLLPVDAPGTNCEPDHCLSMDWVLSMFNDYNPALNLVLLDICRKFIPSNLEAFSKYAEQYRQNVKINRNIVYGYATSGGVGAYEVKGEINGVFMKYLKNRITLNAPIIDVLNRVFRDVEKDAKVRDVQIPELRSNLTKPRSLHDPLIFSGHTTSYDHHTMHWRLMHELPNPVKHTFSTLGIFVTVWFDFCGHFTNKAYVFSSVGDIKKSDDEGPPSELAQSFRAYLQFDRVIDCSLPKIYSDDEEGESLCYMVSHLQRVNGEVVCTLNVKKKNENAESEEDTVVSVQLNLGHVLITRVFAG